MIHDRKYYRCCTASSVESAVTSMIQRALVTAYSFRAPICLHWQCVWLSIACVCHHMKPDEQLTALMCMGSTVVSHTDRKSTCTCTLRTASRYAAESAGGMLPAHGLATALSLDEGSQFLYTVVITVVVCMLSSSVTGSI